MYWGKTGLMSELKSIYRLIFIHAQGENVDDSNLAIYSTSLYFNSKQARRVISITFPRFSIENIYIYFEITSPYRQSRGRSFVWRRNSFDWEPHQVREDWNGSEMVQPGENPNTLVGELCCTLHACYDCHLRRFPRRTRRAFVLLEYTV